MDLNTITIILAIITIIPTVGGLIIQARRERQQSELDKKKASAEEEVNKTRSEMEAKQADIELKKADLDIIINPLRDEVARLNENGKSYQIRISELENALIIKTKEYGVLMLENIDKDSELRTLKYRMGEMQMKLDAVIPTKSKKESTVPLKLKQELTQNEIKKASVKEETFKKIEELKNGSITNVLGE